MTFLFLPALTVPLPCPSGGGGVQTPPPPPVVLSCSEGLEAPKVQKKVMCANEVAPKVPEKVFDWPKARKKIWSNLLGGGGGGVVWDPPPPPPAPGGAELLEGALGSGQQQN